MAQFVIESDGQNEDACGRRADIANAIVIARDFELRLAHLCFNDEAASLADTISNLQIEYLRLNDAILDWENRDGESDTRASNWHHGRLGVDVG